MTIVVCIPGNSFSSEFFIRWTIFLQYCQQKGIKLILSQQHSNNIYYVRNMCLGGNTILGINQKPFNSKIEYDYILWIDSDIIFTPEQFEKLLANDKDIVSGLYRMENYTQFAAVKEWDEEYFKKNGGFQFLTDEDVKGKLLPFQVSYAGLGFTLVKKGVFESLEYPWFKPHFQKIGEAVDFSMEDVGFCLDAKEKGYEIWIDPTVIVGHQKKFIV